MFKQLTIFLCLALTVSGIVSAEKPNVIIVITDDQGYGDLSCHGNPVLKTPNLDRLYADSVRLADYHVAPTCSPTRAALLTGHWTNRTGVWHTIMGRSMLRENEVTLGQAFQDNGYATGMFGKWHLGDNYPFRPEDRGFTEVLRHGGGGVGQTPDYWDNAYFDGSYWHNGTPTPVKGFCSDVFFDYATRFIKQQKSQNKPFLAYIATNAPHGPMHAPEEFSAPYAEQGVPVANFLGMIANIDTNVGRLQRFLADEGLAENTIFIFTTDNGTAAGNKIFNAGMRGKKGSEYDGGHRVPFFVRWPAGKLSGGRDVQPITSYVDVMPTLIDLCGIQAPDGVKFDGRSIRPLLNDTAGNDWPDRILVTDSQRVKDPIKWRKSAVMTSRWRLINGQELYDIQADPSQQNNVIENHRAVANRLLQFYEDWWAELKPTFKINTNIYIGHPAENPARLTSHDWITSGSTPWNQAQIRRAAKGPNLTGYWNINVFEAGEYELRFRRWPLEADLEINAPLEPGLPVPGVQPMRMAKGQAIHADTVTVRVGTQTQSTRIPEGAKEVNFTMQLEPGKTQLEAYFGTPTGERYGCYYAYIEKK